MKHTYSSFKHSMRAGVKTAEDQQRFASVSTKLFKGEMKLLKKLYVSGPQIENAFHAFITSPITKAAVDRLLPEYYKREEEEALASNTEYSRTPYFNLIHKIKTDLYSELPEEEREFWRGKAEKKTEQWCEDSLSEDR